MSKNLHIKAYGVLPYSITDRGIKILLCKSVTSKDKWGCLKGVKIKDETAFECAKRELYEESNINVDIDLFEEYFEQINIEKDIGIWLVNTENIENLNKLFIQDKLKEDNLSWENSKVKFFCLNNLPSIKKKQKNLIADVIDFLESKHQFH